MPTEIKQLKENGVEFYPVTVGEAVMIDNNTTVSSKINSIESNSGNPVKYVAQSLTEEQQMQARKNQGLYYTEEGEGEATLTFDGDLTNATLMYEYSAYAENNIDVEEEFGGQAMLFAKISDKVAENILAARADGEYDGEPISQEMSIDQASKVECDNYYYISFDSEDYGIINGYIVVVQENNTTVSVIKEDGTDVMSISGVDKGIYVAVMSVVENSQLTPIMHIGSVTYFGEAEIDHKIPAKYIDSNINIEGAVKYNTSQNLTDEQKATARKNQGLYTDEVLSFETGIDWNQETISAEYVVLYSQGNVFYKVRDLGNLDLSSLSGSTIKVKFTYNDNYIEGSEDPEAFENYFNYWGWTKESGNIVIYKNSLQGNLALFVADNVELSKNGSSNLLLNGIYCAHSISDFKIYLPTNKIDSRYLNLDEFDYVEYKPQSLTFDQKNQTIENIGLQKQVEDDEITIYSSGVNQFMTYSGFNQASDFYIPFEQITKVNGISINNITYQVKDLFVELKGRAISGSVYMFQSWDSQLQGRYFAFISADNLVTKDENNISVYNGVYINGNYKPISYKSFNGTNPLSIVRYREQYLTEKQQMQSRINQGLYARKIYKFVWDEDTTAEKIQLGGSNTSWAFYKISNKNEFDNPIFLKMTPSKYSGAGVHEWTSIEENVQTINNINVTSGKLSYLWYDSNAGWISRALIANDVVLENNITLDGIYCNSSVGAFTISEVVNKISSEYIEGISYNEQDLTEVQQMQARKNQGLYYKEEGGSTYIEWNGNPTENESVSVNGETFYKISNETISPDRIFRANGNMVWIEGIDAYSTVQQDEVSSGIYMIYEGYEENVIGFIVYNPDLTEFEDVSQDMQELNGKSGIYVKPDISNLEIITVLDCNSNKDETDYFDIGFYDA